MISVSIRMAILAWLTLLILPVPKLRAQNIWNRTYGGNYVDIINKAIQCSDGGFLAVGSKNNNTSDYDYWIFKTDSSGEMLWTKTFGGIWWDKANSVIQTQEGYLIAGYSHSFGANGSDFWLIKTDTDGDTIWTRTYDSGEPDVASDVINTSDSCYLISGWRGSAYMLDNSNCWLVKINANGDTLWTRTYYGNNGGFVEPYSLSEEDNGHIALAGCTTEFGFPQAWAMVIESSGDLFWSHTYLDNLEPSIIRSIIATQDGGYLLTGYVGSSILLIKTDSMGDTLWTRTYGGGNDYYDEGYSAIQIADGSYLVAGYTWSVLDGDSDYWLIKTDLSGDSLWSRTYDLTYMDEAYSIIETFDQGYLLAGTVRPPSSPYFTNIDGWLVKTDSLGYSPSPLNIIDKSLPDDLEVISVYPNPFNDDCIISYKLNNTSDVKISAYNILGSKILERNFNHVSPGIHSLTWNSILNRDISVSSGIYILNIATENHSMRTKLIFLK